MAAEIADAIVKECQHAFGEGATSRLQSSRLLSLMSHGFRSGHAAEATRLALGSMLDVSFPLPISMVDVGTDTLSPVIFLSDYIKTLARLGKLSILTGKQPFSRLREFWINFQTLRPQHPVFDLDESEWSYAIPLYLIADEGRGLKKSAVMVLGSEPVLGFGCDQEDEATAAETLKMNFRGNTFQTRQLFSVMPKKRYSKTDNPLHALISAWSADLGKTFREGLLLDIGGTVVRIRAVVIGLKGDWPALDKLGRLVRHFRREAYPWGAGICHLCEANSERCPEWHHHDLDTAPWVASMNNATKPWLPGKESSFTIDIPMEENMKPMFYLIDLFHTCHKGVHADLAGSAIASRL